MSALALCAAGRRNIIKTHLWWKIGVNYSTNSSLPLLTLYTKDPCPLCDEAKLALQPAMDKVKFEEVDITANGNEHWWHLYKYEIPVFYLNGRFLMKHRGNLKLLEDELEKLKNDT